MLKIAYGSFIINFTFGLLVKARVIDSRKFHLAHHGIYFVVMATLFAAISLDLWNEREIPYLLIGLFGLLLGLSRFGGRSAGHWQYATLCLIIYSAIIIYKF